MKYTSKIFCISDFSICLAFNSAPRVFLLVTPVYAGPNAESHTQLPSSAIKCVTAAAAPHHARAFVRRTHTRHIACVSFGHLFCHNRQLSLLCVPLQYRAHGGCWLIFLHDKSARLVNYVHIRLEQ
jgi:hypothetical protein